MSSPTPPPSGIQETPEEALNRVKRKNEELQAENDELQRKKKKVVTISQMGRQIPRVVNFMCDVGALVMEADRRAEIEECHMAGRSPPVDTEMARCIDEDEKDDLRLRRERNFRAFKLLHSVLPGLRNELATKTPDQLQNFFSHLQSGANDARSDDLSRIMNYTAQWPSSLSAQNPLAGSTRLSRGLDDDILGGYLCSIDLDWNDLSMRQKIRANDDPEFFFGKTYFLRGLYPESKDEDNFDQGYLQCANLFKTWVAIFRSPKGSTAALTDAQLQNPTLGAPIPACMQKQRGLPNSKPCNEDIVHMKKVTPRSIAYAAVMYIFNLTAATHWSEEVDGFSFPGLYAHIVDYLEDTPDEESEATSTDIMAWWNIRAFPSARPAVPEGNIVYKNSRKRLAAQREARRETTS